MAATATITAEVAIPPLKLVAKHDIKALIGYTRPPANGGEPSMDDLASEHPLYRDVRTANVYDVRGFENQFTPEEHGFQYFKLPSIPGEGVVNFEDESDPMILAVYYQGMAEWFAKEIGAKKVVIFDHIVRNEPHYPREEYSMGIRGPAMRPHIDVTHKYTPQMFRDVYSRVGTSDVDIDSILNSKHWQSYNLWRPIKIVKRDALAMLDTRSFTRDQLVSASFDRGDGHFVSMDWLQSGLKPGEGDEMLAHKWYYMHEQRPDECVAFKIFDSNPAASSNGTPHAAVHIPGTEEEETRCSIEVRCFAIFE